MKSMHCCQADRVLSGEDFFGFRSLLNCDVHTVQPALIVRLLQLADHEFFANCSSIPSTAVVSATNGEPRTW